MALELIDHAPVLDGDYRLFYWDDFPRSRDALVTGTPTERFETSCWNTMVSKLEDVMIALEYDSWDKAPYFYYGEKKNFTAAMYNEMLKRLEQIFPLYDISDKFDYTPKKGSVLTPGHLLYIAKWLNLVLGVSNGLITLEEMRMRRFSWTTFDAYVDVWDSVLIETSNHLDKQCRTTSSVGFDQLPAAPMFSSFTLMSNLGVSAQAPNVLLTEVDQRLKTKLSMSATRIAAATLPKIAVIDKSKSLARISVTTKNTIAMDAISHSIMSGQVNISQPANAAADHIARGVVLSQMHAPEQLPVSVSETTKANTKAIMESLPSVNAGLMIINGKSNALIEVACQEAVDSGKIRHLAGSYHQVKILTPYSAAAAFDILGKSSLVASFQTPAAEYVKTYLGMKTQQAAKIIMQTARQAWVDGFAWSESTAEMERLDAVNIVAEEIGKTEVSCSLELLQTTNAEPETLAFGSVSCEAAIFLLPLQPDRKTLYIRQTYQEPLKIGKTLYIDQWPDQGLTDDGTLFLWRIFDTVIHVGNTLYIGSMPNTGMTDGETLLIWDVEQEPVKKNTLLEVF